MTSPIFKFLIFYRISVHAEALHNARELVVLHETVAEHICNLVDSKPCHIWLEFAICIRCSCRGCMQKGASALLSQEKKNQPFRGNSDTLLSSDSSIAYVIII